MVFAVRPLAPAGWEETNALLRSVGVSAAGTAYMRDKGVFHILRADGLAPAAARILKQEMLSRGGECALHEKVLTGETGPSSVLLMGTERQLRELCRKLAMQQFALPRLAEELLLVLENLEKREFAVPYKDGELTLGRKTAIMGILNVTPDSFSDGGLYMTPEAALQLALGMQERGADIIDVGGESTRPGFLPVDAEEEKKRVLPVIAALMPLLKIPVSIDTSKAEVAEAALLAGASIINDQGGLQKDPRMAALAAATDAPVVVMHNPEKETPEDGDLMGDMIAFFRRSIALGLEAGMRENRFILDPGLGFKKTQRQNFQALARLAELRCLGLPILAGPSRKSFMGRLLDLPPAGLDGATAAAAALSVANGAHLLRVHDVGATVQAAKIADAVAGQN